MFMCNVSFLIATELMSISDVCQIAEKLEKLSPECLENVANKLQKHVDENALIRSMMPVFVKIKAKTNAHFTFCLIGKVS